MANSNEDDKQRTINHLLSVFESLVRMRNMLPVTDLPIIKQYLLDQEEDFIKTVTLCAQKGD